MYELFLVIVSMLHVFFLYDKILSCFRRFAQRHVAFHARGVLSTPSFSLLTPLLMAPGGMGACGADKNFMIDLRTHKQPGSGRRCIPPGVHGWEIYVKFSRKDFATTRDSDSGKNKHKTFITSTGITLYSKTGCPYTRSCEILVEIKSFEWFLNFLDR